LAPELILQFQVGNVTHIDADQRRALPAGLAQWFHAFYSSHREPLPLKLADLARWAGHASTEAKTFNRYARAALDALVRVGFLASYGIARGVLSVVRAGAVTETESDQGQGDVVGGEAA
jgi:hypothetical protein